MTTHTTETETPMQNQRPDWLPEKFWDEKSGAPRIQELAQSYMELENRFSKGETRNVPQDPSAYTIAIDDDLLDVDEEVNQRLFEKGFNNDQAQLVYDLAVERLMPMVQEVSALYENEREMKKLQDHFGGEERFETIRPQLRAWGKTNLEKSVFENLISSAEGVIALHEMMKSREPSLMRVSENTSGVKEDELKAMMKDPRYWKHRDPAYVAKVRNGFRKLYPES